MSRKLWLLCTLVLGLAFGAPQAHAQDGAPPPPPPGRAEQGSNKPRDEVTPDGPAPVDSQESISAGAGDDLSGHNTQGSGATGGGGINIEGKVRLRPSGDEHHVGVYTGVEPGTANPPPVAASVPPGTTPATITWPGFQMRPNGTSRVFVQSTASVPAQTSSDGNKFIVKFPGTKVPAATNRFPLETRYFNTPVSRVTIATPHDGVVLTLELRASVTPHVSSEKGPSGYYFTYIDLPAGKFLEGGVQPMAAPPSAASDAPPAPDSTEEHATHLDGDLDLKTKRKGGAAMAGGAASGKGNVKASGGMSFGK